jgi:poly(hydroxyalkanoate) granule associated protein phasin
MIQNINGFLGNVAQTSLGKAARRSAGTILNAHLDAFRTTRQEAGKVMGIAIKESQKFRERARSKADGVVENLAGAADDQLSALEQGVSRVIRRIGLPTAKDVSMLSRRIEALATQVEVRARKVKKAARRSNAKRAA